MSERKSIARRSYEAYARSDHAAIDALIAADFHFTSPLDNRIDRAGYFQQCWPNNETISKFRFVRLVEDGDEVCVTYEGTGSGGRRFRNTEVLTVRDGRITEAEVYFGWNVPHQAPENGSVEPPVNGGKTGILTLLAQVSCSDLGKSIDWFEKLLGRTFDARPMDGLAEWHHGAGGLQLHQNAASAGYSTVTLIVADLGEVRRRLVAAGLSVGEVEAGDHVDIVLLRDPDDNLIVAAQVRQPDKSDRRGA